MSNLFTFSWLYTYIDRSGILVDENGFRVFSNDYCPKFTTPEEAEAWLEANDERANCLGFYKNWNKEEK